MTVSSGKGYGLGKSSGFALFLGLSRTHGAHFLETVILSFFTLKVLFYLLITVVCVYDSLYDSCMTVDDTTMTVESGFSILSFVLAYMISMSYASTDSMTENKALRPSGLRGYFFPGKLPAGLGEVVTAHKKYLLSQLQETPKSPSKGNIHPCWLSGRWEKGKTAWSGRIYGMGTTALYCKRRGSWWGEGQKFNELRGWWGMKGAVRFESGVVPGWWWGRMRATPPQTWWSGGPMAPLPLGIIGVMY